MVALDLHGSLIISDSTKTYLHILTRISRSVIILSTAHWCVLIEAWSLNLLSAVGFVSSKKNPCCGFNLSWSRQTVLQFYNLHSFITSVVECRVSTNWSKSVTDACPTCSPQTTHFSFGKHWTPTAKSWFPSVGPGRLNQLGGAYINGKPLPNEIRQQILALANQGFRPCDISRRLRITHGCISKLLSKYRKTGSIEAGGESAGRPRVITPRIAQRIMEYRKEQPGLFSWEIRDRLVHEGLCSKESLPSLSSVSRLLKNKHKSDPAPGIIRERNSNSYMIASILNLPPSNGQSSTSMSSPSIDSHGQILKQKQTGQWKNYFAWFLFACITIISWTLYTLVVPFYVPQFT